MGTIRNEMTIVHHFEKDVLEKLREDAIKTFKEVTIELDKDIIDRMVSPMNYHDRQHRKWFLQYLAV